MISGSDVIEEFEELPKFFDETVFKKPLQKNLFKTDTQTTNAENPKLEFIKSEINEGILNSLVIKELKKKANRVCHMQTRAEDHSKNPKSFFFSKKSQFQKREIEFIDEEEFREDFKQTRRLDQESILEGWLADSKSSFVFDVFMEKKETFKSFMESPYFSRGQELHSKLANKAFEIINEHSREEKKGILQANEASKHLENLRLQYWMVELKYEYMNNAYGKNTDRARAAAGKLFSTQQQKVTEKQKLESLLGPRLNSFGNISDTDLSKGQLQALRFSNQNIGINPNSETIRQIELFEKFNDNYEEFKNLRKTLQSNLVSKYLKILNNPLKAQ